MRQALSAGQRNLGWLNALSHPYPVDVRHSGWPHIGMSGYPERPISLSPKLRMKRNKDPRILTCANWKGGVGKTTCAVNIAASAVRCMTATGDPLRVLLVDVDAQASASRSLGILRGDTHQGTADVLLRGVPIRSAIQPTAEGIDLMAGSIALMDADVLLAQADPVQRLFLLARALAEVRSDYDLIIVDSPPSAGVLSLNCMLAGRLLIPVAPEHLCLEGVAILLELVGSVGSSVGCCPEIEGFVVTKADYRSRATREAVDLLRDVYGTLVAQTEIRVNTALAEAPSHGCSIFAHDPTHRSTGARAYQALTRELLTRMGREQETHGV